MAALVGGRTPRAACALVLSTTHGPPRAGSWCMPPALFGRAEPVRRELGSVPPRERSSLTWAGYPNMRARTWPA
jgi:hypothetical protein